LDLESSPLILKQITVDYKTFTSCLGSRRHL